MAELVLQQMNLLYEWPENIRTQFLELGYAIWRERMAEETRAITAAILELPDDSFYPVTTPAGGTQSADLGGFEVLPLASFSGGVNTRGGVRRSGDTMTVIFEASVPWLMPPEAADAEVAPSSPGVVAVTPASGRRQVIAARDLARPQTLSLAQVGSAMSPDQMARPYDVRLPHSNTPARHSLIGDDAQESGALIQVAPLVPESTDLLPAGKTPVRNADNGVVAEAFYSAVDEALANFYDDLLPRLSF